jgi:hypothetical protein
LIPGTSVSPSLSVGVVGAAPHLYILDITQHRVLDLQAAAGANLASTPASTPTSKATGGGGVTGSVMLQLVRQYTSPTLFGAARSMAFDTQKVQAEVLTQSAASMNVIAFGTSSPNGCA